MTPATPRGRMSPARRQHIFSENCTGHNVAPCCICGKPVHRHDDQWIVEHKRALGLLGKDTNTNCGPAHVACASEKTHKQDLPRIRKAKRMAAALPCSDHIPDAGKKKNPARAFQVPTGVVFDWKQRRYVKSTGNATSDK
jgi:hypothetical protein